MSETGTATNPYVGTVAFQKEQSDVFCGRDGDVRRLINQIIADRVVLLYSPSGAGKSSLVNAGIIPKLEAMQGDHGRPRFEVLNGGRPVRVKQVEGTEGEGNRYASAVLATLAPELDPSARQSIELATYLAERCGEGGDRPMHQFIFFDQFEEVFADVSKDAAEERAVFFEQLGAALEDTHRHAVFAVREEYLAAFDPYVRHLPNRMASRFRLELLSAEAAARAIVEPARKRGRVVEPTAAEKIVDDLRRVTVRGRSGKPERVAGLYVEPVHLQVVCVRLWERHLGRGEPVTAASLGATEQSTGEALREHFDARVEQAAREEGIDEGHLRHWLERELVLPGMVRNNVLKGPEATRGLHNRAIERLKAAYLLRQESRHGQEWYEISHDRLVEPIVQSNKVWFEFHADNFVRCAARWVRADRPDALLARGEILDEGRKLRASKGLDEEFATFFEKSTAARKARLRRVITGFGVGVGVSVVLVMLANSQRRKIQWEEEVRIGVLRRLREEKANSEATTQHLRNAIRAMESRLMDPGVEFEGIRSALQLYDTPQTTDHRIAFDPMRTLSSRILQRRLDRFVSPTALATQPAGAVIVRSSDRVFRWVPGLGNAIERPFPFEEARALSPDLSLVLLRDARGLLSIRGTHADARGATLSLDGPRDQGWDEWPRWRSDSRALRIGLDPDRCFDGNGRILDRGQCSEPLIGAAVSPGTRGVVWEA